MTTVITDIRVPADAFPLGRILQAYPDVEIELERLVPTQQELVPLFWVTTESEAAVEETLREDPLVADLVQLTRTSDRTLYSVNWSPDIDALVRTLAIHHVDVLSAKGTANVWELRLQFRDRTNLKRFWRACREQHIEMTLVELFNPMMPPEKEPLTAEEKDALATAYENGYWDIPRKITQQELADLIGVSDGMLSQRLRQGVKLVVGELIFGSDGEPFE